ncbi:MAG TPA: alpha-amylase family glycosyl hydrolase, partial [Polyangiaceae bacterium]|nr:alpha-amylase family glycosyl hydrolase [Polyangiaceae bacterium]
MSLHKTFASVVVAAAVMASPAVASALAQPHRSTTFLPTSNGTATMAFDTAQDKLDYFLEHAYQSASPGVVSRNFLYDSYPGLRVGTTGVWLNTVAPTTIEYLPGTGVVHVVRQTMGVTVDEYDFAPTGLSDAVLFTVLEITRQSGSGAIDVFSLDNYHLGSGSPSPGADSETIAYNGARGAYYEWGPSGVAFGYATLGASTHHGSTPNNPYNRLLAGLDLADDTGTGGATTDAVCGFQLSLGDLAANTPSWVGWYAVLDRTASAQAAVDRVNTFVASRTADKVLSDELAAWQAWQKPAPAGASAFESALYAQSQAMLRMAQVSAPDGSDGQILAAVAPGQWNITWVRDMAYSTVALARAGHTAEAKRALAFELAGSVGGYQSYVGSPYQISVVRYYGNGSEWSDTDANGPNVEFDGFGLFLWALESYVDASSDTASLTTWWPTVQTKVADVLVALQEPGGLIAPDSSIWEVHWNGNQKHFAYTTIAAARGLCAAAHLATKMGDSASATKYLTAGQKARDAILSSLRAPDGTIAQATETLAKGTGFLDAAAIEALSFGLVEPQKHTALATLASIQAGLVPPSGRGFFRNENGGWYDSQEWVFVDMRVGRALERAGQTQASAELLSWNVAQGTENFGILSELHDAMTGDYAGAAPMVGFGAGAYVLSLLDRGQPVAPGCDTFAFEPAEPSDAGTDGAADAGDAGKPVQDASNSDGGTTPPPSSGCSCDAAGTSGSSAGLLAALLAAMMCALRRLAPAMDLGHPGLKPGAGEDRIEGLDSSPPSADSRWARVSRNEAGARRRRALTWFRSRFLCLPRASARGGPFLLPACGTLMVGLFAGSLLLLGCGGGGSTNPDGGDAGALDSPADVPEPPLVNADAGACTTTFTFTPPSGSTASSVSVTGEWDSFAQPGTTMTGPDEHGAFTAKVPLAPGWYAYKLIVDGQWQLDPLSTMRKYVGTVENSAVTVTDCYLPSMRLGAQTNARPASGQGHYTAHVDFVPGWAGTQLDTKTVVATLRKDGADKPVAATANELAESIDVDLPSLADGKYTLFVDARDRLARAAHRLRLVFWIEGETFDWHDSLIYMAATDRLKNGDPSNDVGPTPNVDPRADFHNGDLAGVKQVIDSGALDQLGVRTLWLTPFNTNPKGAYLDSDGVDLVTGYHGYWPVKGREVEPRLGGDAALKALVATAHAHGMRILMDFVIHHVHQEHEYFAQHPEWFHQGCLCGTANCDWDSHRLDCVFTTYLPNIDWTVPAASQQFEDDAVWWMDTYDLDGFRVDAVKQVPDAAVMNVTTVLRREFEASGLRVFLTGETAMGWSDCGLSCNQWQYDLISHYIGPEKLDGQFDFPLYYAVPMQVFAADYHSTIHADYWTQASGWEYPAGSIMSPYIGSQDTPRFVTIASSPALAGNKWTNVAPPPSSSEPYRRLQVAMTWLLGLPGAPMIYYGDEYGEWGGADPNNRADWRGDSTTLSGDEQATLALVRKLGQVRKSLVALRRGDYRHVFANDLILVYARVTP